MFLVDSANAGSDWDGVIAAITKTLERAEVDIVSITKWDDRRLAYEIKRMARGTYILCYFRSDGQKNQEIETAVQLSEKITRVLILCVDWMTDEEIQQDTPATKDQKEKEAREATRAVAEEAKAAAAAEAAAQAPAEEEAQAPAEPEPVEEEVEAPAEAEPVEEAAPVEAEAVAEEAQPEQAAEATEEPATAETAEPEAAETTEPAAPESDDAQDEQPKVSADD